jgi:hypothetical protein
MGYESNLELQFRKELLHKGVNGIDNGFAPGSNAEAMLHHFNSSKDVEVTRGVKTLPSRIIGWQIFHNRILMGEAFVECF